MRYEYENRFWLLLVVGLALVAFGCQKQPQVDQTVKLQVSKSENIGKKLASLVKAKRHEEAVIELRKSLGELKGQYEKDCARGFTQAGASQKDWDLILKAAKSPEFETGKNYAEKLRNKRLQDADIVEYLKGTLRNAPDFSKLAFSAGFVSVFEKKEAGMTHLDTLWIWAMSP